MKANLQKHTLHLRAGDWDYLESICKPNGVPTSLAVRTLVSEFVDRKRAEERRAVGPQDPLNLSIEL